MTLIRFRRQFRLLLILGLCCPAACIHLLDAAPADYLFLAQNLAEQENWTEAVRVMRDYTLRDVRDESGRPVVCEFMRQLHPGETAPLKKWEKMMASLRQFVATHGSDPWTLTLQARELANAASRYQTSAYPQGGNKPEYWENYRQCYDEALATLDKVTVNDRSMIWYETWMEAAKVRDVPAEKVMSVAKEAMVQVSLPDNVITEVGNYFSPESHGDAQAMINAYDQLLPLIKAPEAQALCRSSAYWIYFAQNGDKGAASLNAKHRTEISKAFDTRARLYPSLLVKDARAFIACMFGDKEKAAAWFRQSSLPQTSLWGQSDLAYVDWRRWAMGERSEDEADAKAFAVALVGRWRTVDYHGDSVELTPEYFKKEPLTVTIFTDDNRRIEEYYMNGPDKPLTGSKTWEYRVVSPNTYEYRLPGGEWWQRYAYFKDGRLHIRIVSGGDSTFIYERMPDRDNETSTPSRQ